MDNYESKMNNNKTIKILFLITLQKRRISECPGLEHL